ncbi:hypothetical protein [Sphingomonas sp. CFBP 13706]|uniref:hypothetical protein n=1 Tax=Sphingomonas sp. CFBP 13706 TaxID=2775314 RepID=UPI00177AF0A6|nr:hypothetical protein [Sphingomonas sp. CFBP 13706]MBD8733913.1 hypothetical protein [Sphingomonas sp. CFBP 13706]
MTDPLVTHEELALAMETIRRYVLMSGALTVAVHTDKQEEIMKSFKEEDEHYVEFVAALRGK